MSANWVHSWLQFGVWWSLGWGRLGVCRSHIGSLVGADWVFGDRVLWCGHEGDLLIGQRPKGRSK